jgi:sec-independent protein translocase protein TatB
MFDFSWTEIALVGVVALVAIGPKDLPVAIKTIAGFVKKARRMAAEFQGHFDEMVREANLHEVQQQFNELRNFDIKGQIEKAIDSDGSLSSLLNEKPLAGVLDALPDTPVAAHPETVIDRPEGVAAEPAAEPVAVAVEPDYPAFLPPELIPPPEPEAPAFVPPGTRFRGS